MKELDEKLVESEAELDKITNEISLIEDEMNLTMGEIMKLGTETLGLE